MESNSVCNHTSDSQRSFYYIKLHLTLPVLTPNYQELNSFWTEPVLSSMSIQPCQNGHYFFLYLNSLVNFKNVDQFSLLYVIKSREKPPSWNSTPCKPCPRLISCIWSWLLLLVVDALGPRYFETPTYFKSLNGLWCHSQWIRSL